MVFPIHLELVFKDVAMLEYINLINVDCLVISMPQSVEKSEKRDLTLEDLIEGTKESLRQAKGGKTLSDNDSIRERIEEYRKKS